MQNTVLNTVTVAALALLCLGACAPAPSPPDAEQARVVCRDDRRMGSNLSRRTCKPVDELKAERAAYQEELRTLKPGRVELQEPAGGPP